MSSIHCVDLPLLSLSEWSSSLRHTLKQEINHLKYPKPPMLSQLGQNQDLQHAKFLAI